MAAIDVERNPRPDCGNRHGWRDTAQRDAAQRDAAQRECRLCMEHTIGHGPPLQSNIPA